MARGKGKPTGQRKVNNVAKNRNKVKWSPLQEAVVPDEAKKTGVVAAAQNSLYTIFIKETTAPGFEMPVPGGPPEPMKIRHLLILRNDRKKTEIKWEHKQRIKDELCGQMCEAVELFPASWRVQDMKQTHLWVLAPGASFPLGVFPKELANQSTPADVTVTKEELEVFVVRGEDLIEVFASEAEAQKMYKEAGNELSGGGIERIGDVPTVDDGAAWTDAAKAKVANIIAKAERMDQMNSPVQQEAAESPFYDEGPDSFEEEVGEGFDMSLLQGKAQEIYGPPSTEEGMQIAEYMERTLSKMKGDREIRIGGAAEMLGDKFLEQTKEAESEEEAAADLSKYREEHLKGKAKPGPGEDPNLN